MKLIAILAAFVALDTSAATLSSPSVSGGQFSFLYDSSPDQLLTVQAAEKPDGTWTDLISRRGTGTALSFTTAASNNQRFFRVRATAFHELALEPSAPTLASGAISLPDAVAAASYRETISTLQNGVPPYTLQVLGTLPDGLGATVLSNGTPNAQISITTNGLPLTVGQRLQFAISATDAAGTNISRAFNIRVVAAPPKILTTLVTLKAGVSAGAAMEADGGEGLLKWEIVSGPKPKGVALTSSGIFLGSPEADDAEFQLTGRFTNEVRVTDSFTDRVTGLPAPRSTTSLLVQNIKLSFQQNIFGETSLGPRFGSHCTGCHTPDFLPNIGEGTTALINVGSRSDLSCAQKIYIIPGNPSASLIYQKVTAPDCGVRMPWGGFLEDSAIELLRRWIEELGPDEMD
jgi:hypothetical protein